MCSWRGAWNASDIVQLNPNSKYLPMWQNLSLFLLPWILRKYFDWKWIYVASIPYNYVLLSSCLVPVGSMITKAGNKWW